MFYLMSWVREKLEKKQINNETHSTGEGKKKKKKKTKKKEKKKKREKKKKLGLRLLSKQVRGTF